MEFGAISMSGKSSVLGFGCLSTLAASPDIYVNVPCRLAFGGINFCVVLDFELTTACPYRIT